MYVYNVGTYIGRQIGKWTYGQMVNRSVGIVNFVYVPFKKVEPFVTNVFETVQGTPVTEFVKQLSTRCAAASGDGVTDVDAAMLRVLYISDSTAGTICNKQSHILTGH
jgi:hypothetical protein